MNNYSKILNNAVSRPWQVTLSFLGLSFLTSASLLNAEVVFDASFDDLATGTLSADTHPNWEGMLEGNTGGQDPSDWEVEEGSGLTWVAEDGGTIDGGNKHLDMRAISNITGRAYYNFDTPLPTDTGQPTSIYLRWVASFDQFEDIGQNADGSGRSVWPVIRFNGSWQMRSVVKWREFPCADCTDLRFHIELHDDKDLASGARTVAFMEDKLGEPVPMTPYLVVTRYDFDAAGVLQGQAMWLNPNFADMGTPDVVSNHTQPGYDTFVNPIVSMDITTYGGTVRYDNIKIATTWEEVVPQGNGTVFLDASFDDLATGTLSADTHPNWEGMLEGNTGGQDPSDWEVEEGSGLTWVAEDGGTIDGGNKHLDMRAISNITGRAYYNFDTPLPTDTGQPTSIYLRWVASFDQFEDIGQNADGSGRSVWPVIRFNGSWQMRSVVKWREFPCADCTDLRFHIELHDDKDLASGARTVAFMEDKLGEPVPMTPYLVVTRYDFDAAGVLQGQAMWLNPNFADMGTPDVVSNHTQPGYDTFVNPIVSMDITTYGGTVRYDNIKIADSWAAVVPQPAISDDTWAGYPVLESGDCNTGDWIGWVSVYYEPWIYSYNLNQWMYIDESAVTESGSWVYAFNF